MKLGLGTAQLGMEYGVANRTGKPDENAARAILKAAVDGGVDCVDTAGAYGDSEAIIGGFIKESGARLKISSKFSDCLTVEAELDGALRRLGVESLDYFLLHRPEQVFTEDFAYAVETIKRSGAVGKVGVSVYTRREIDECLKHGIQVLQIPFNILDTRLTADGTLRRIKDAGVELHARSIYLQGLLLNETADIGADATGYISALDGLAAECGLSRKELCFLYARDSLYVDRFFIGCETVAQVNENLRINRLPPMRGLGGVFADVPEEILNPALWKKRVDDGHI